MWSIGHTLSLSLSISIYVCRHAVKQLTLYFQRLYMMMSCVLSYKYDLQISVANRKAQHICMSPEFPRLFSIITDNQIRFGVEDNRTTKIND